MARVEAKTARVDRWRTSDQKLRWCAAALLAAEAKFRRIKGYKHLPLLERALIDEDHDDHRRSMSAYPRLPPEFQLISGHTP
jgi:hypothetical protein